MGPASRLRVWTVGILRTCLPHTRSAVRALDRELPENLSAATPLLLSSTMSMALSEPAATAGTLQAFRSSGAMVRFDLVTCAAWSWATGGARRLLALHA